MGSEDFKDMKPKDMKGAGKETKAAKDDAKVKMREEKKEKTASDRVGVVEEMQSLGSGGFGLSPLRKKGGDKEDGAR
jgi:hypothetical protein